MKNTINRDRAKLNCIFQSLDYRGESLFPILLLVFCCLFQVFWKQVRTVEDTLSLLFLILVWIGLDLESIILRLEIATYLGQKSSNIGSFIGGCWLPPQYLSFFILMILSLTLVTWPWVIKQLQDRYLCLHNKLDNK